MTLALGSERFAATGSVQASGARRLLGTPKMPLLHTLLREAGQNSCDAAIGAAPVRVLVRLRHLTSEERRSFRDTFAAALPPDSSTTRKLAAFLRSECAAVLEFCDFGTRGLGGPTRADIVMPDARTDFVDFIRNIGVTRDVARGGGTYGYGKSVLYSASACSMIVVDSLTAEMERRLIGCHLGDALETGGVRLTGRHWWGAAALDREDFVDPVGGDEAARLSRSLGMPERSDGASGTSIMILDPVLPHEDLAASAAEAAEAMLWFFWPRMLRNETECPLVCAIEAEGVPVEVPRPEVFPPLDLFAEAWRAVRHGGGNAVDVRSEKPKRLLGKMSLRTGFRNPRVALAAPERSIIPETSSHIAIMRPVDLVVKYIAGAPSPTEGQEWAGVFVCDEAEDVEAAFAQAEPPAHDDWDTEAMAKGHAKTFVNVALRQIKRAAQEWALPPAAAAPPTDGVQPSLARASELIGATVPVSSAQRLARKGSRRRAAAELHVNDPVFVSLHQGEAGVEALFRVKASNLSAAAVTLRATPGLVLDGVLSSEWQGPDGDATRVIAWESEDGAVLEAGASVHLAAGATLDARVRVSVPRLTAVGVDVRLERAPS
jgi:hypothetical protein